MMQNVLHLGRLRLAPTGGRDTEFPVRLHFRMHRLPSNACSIRTLVQGKPLCPTGKKGFWREWDVQWRSDGAPDEGIAWKRTGRYPQTNQRGVVWSSAATQTAMASA